MIRETLRADSTDFVGILRKKCGSEEVLSSTLRALEADLGGAQRPERLNILAAIALIKHGSDAETIAKGLSWDEFEEFCAGLLRASGFEVTRNIVLRRPRLQIDILARSHEIALSIDCKQWRKTAGSSALQRFARDQLARTAALRAQKRLGEAPCASLILTLTEEAPRFVQGVAIVPIFSLKSFLSSLYEFRENLRLL